MEVVASLSQGRTAVAHCGLFTHKSVPVIFEPPCTFTFISLLPLHKYLLKLVKGTIPLFVLEHAVHTFFAINLSKRKKKKDMRVGRAYSVY